MNGWAVASWGLAAILWTGYGCLLVIIVRTIKEERAKVRAEREAMVARAAKEAMEQHRGTGVTASVQYAEETDAQYAARMQKFAGQ